MRKVRWILRGIIATIVAKLIRGYGYELIVDKDTRSGWTIIAADKKR